MMTQGKHRRPSRRVTPRTLFLAAVDVAALGWTTQGGPVWLWLPVLSVYVLAAVTGALSPHVDVSAGDPPQQHVGDQIDVEHG